MTEPLVGVILAGGLSRRMGGGDKCLRLLAGRPMLAHIIDLKRLRFVFAVLIAIITARMLWDALG